MGIEEDIRIDEQADDFMSKPPQIREKLLYVAVLNNDQRLRDLSNEVTFLSENGCKRYCEAKHETAMQRWTPATVGTALMGLIYGAVELLKSK